MTIKKLVEKYVKNTEKVLQQISDQVNHRESEVQKVLDYANRYYEDAKYYSNQNKFETALASIAYSEGLLEALKILDLVHFQWITRI
jgi:FAD synthetase